jgi:hypothetical protein
VNGLGVDFYSHGLIPMVLGLIDSLLKLKQNLKVYMQNQGCKSLNPRV